MSWEFGQRDTPHWSGYNTRGDWKYGSQHHLDCTCDQCLHIMETHDRRNQAPCPCDDCWATRARLRLINETRSLERQPLQERVQDVANIAICDRPNCGSLIKSSVAGLVELIPTPGNNDEIVRGQLCPACAGDFVSLWESTDVGHREKSYSKGWQRPSKTDLSSLSSTQLMQLAIERGREELSDSDTKSA